MAMSDGMLDGVALYGTGRHRTCPVALNAMASNRVALHGRTGMLPHGRARYVVLNVSWHGVAVAQCDHSKTSICCITIT
eukprot:354028-Chlamydomonas_euryale.AAC.8